MLIFEWAVFFDEVGNLIVSDYAKYGPAEFKQAQSEEAVEIKFALPLGRVDLGVTPLAYNVYPEYDSYQENHCKAHEEEHEFG